MEMSKACTHPVHAQLDAKDARHPRYQEYLAYRAAMSAQLVSCISFDSWLRQAEQSELADLANRHPRIGDYRLWLRESVNCTPPKAVYMDFWQWLGQNQ